MSHKVHTAIVSAISRKKGGEILFPTDFRGTGTQLSINKALSRLAKKGTVRRLAHGIYYIPKNDPVLGALPPEIDDVVTMVAKKERIRIRPAGAYALHRLGLTTQVPTKRVYITDGNARQFRLGKVQVKFKPTSSKKLSTTGKISSLVIQALEELGTGPLDKQVEQKLYLLLRQEDPKTLRQDLALASGRVNDYIVRLMKRPVTDHD